MKVQYSGLSDTRSLLSTETINGAIPGGILVAMTFNRANSYIIDFTQAPYTGCAAGTGAALIALPNNEFKDVTSTGFLQSNIATYPAPVGTTSPTGHVVSSGAVVGVASGAGSTGAAVGPLGANDEAGEITCTSLASGNTANSPLVVVTFAVPYAAPPKNVDISGGNAASEALLPYAPVALVTAAGFTIEGEVVAGVSQALIFSYAVTG